MKKLLRFSALLTLAALVMPALAAAFPVKTEAPEAVLSPAPLYDKTAAESPSAIVTEQKGFDESASVTLWNGSAVETLSLRDYLEGVLAAEMPADFPEEALKAQAVAARTYALYKAALSNGEAADVHHGAQLCTDPAHCEAFLDLAAQASSLWGGGAEMYQERICRAVKETDGLILTYGGEPIAAVFCAASAEQTESASDVWGEEMPYLISVPSPGGQDCGNYFGETHVSLDDFRAAMAARHPDAAFSDRPEEWISQADRSPAGGIRSLTVGGTKVKGTELRQCFGLNSTNFTIRVEGDELIFSTIGYGHGVGLSQYGARYMALSGETFEAILSHYYPGAALTEKTEGV
ncbi:MAG: stage II sporulation protein D [Clostridia bacterium]|nr:stage II sporulation protein D [Clostridia bacterium]